MKKIMLGGILEVPEIALGCMRIPSLKASELRNLIDVSLENGINFFDHADIYGGGGAEENFGDMLKADPSLRDKMIIQSKCGIRKGMFDFSKEHILSSVDGILKRLKTDSLDVLLLHRPDSLMEPDEVAEAFLTLKKVGKVKFFGVSNQNGGQIALLQRAFSDKLVANQLQLSITTCPMIDAGFNVNMLNDASVNHDGGVLEYCRLNDITIQPWSPFQYGFFEGVFIDSDKYVELNEAMAKIGKKYGITKNAVAIAWILRHPAKMQPIVGTTDAKRLQDICKASDVTLTREEWYEIYRMAGKILP